MSSFCLHVSPETLAPLGNSIVDNPLIQSHPHVQQTLFEIVDIMDCSLLDFLLRHAAHFIIDRIQIWTVRRP